MASPLTDDEFVDLLAAVDAGRERCADIARALLRAEVHPDAQAELVVAARHLRLASEALYRSI